LFVAVTMRANAPLLDAIGAGPGMRVIDVAAGPGHLSRAAAERGAHVVGADLSPAMVLLARELHSGIEFVETPAEALPFDDASFDAVLCAFGLGHFPEPERVLAEFARVLKPGGTMALSWWRGFNDNRINGIFHEAIGAIAKPAQGAAPPGPPMDRFSDPARLTEFIGAAGFQDIHVNAHGFQHRLRDTDELWDLAMGSFARASATIAAQSEDVRRAIRDRVDVNARPYCTTDGLDIPVAFLVGAGRKPR
jgi:ubiquinone/menaquinone biosynthesis C-methylase UbiE